MGVGQLGVGLCLGLDELDARLVNLGLCLIEVVAARLDRVRDRVGDDLIARVGGTQLGDERLAVGIQLRLGRGFGAAAACASAWAGGRRLGLRLAVVHFCLR